MQVSTSTSSESDCEAPTDAPDLRPENRPYQPRGSGLDILYSHDPEVIVSGPAGTGKSRAILEKLHLVAEKYPGCRILFCRKTRAALTQSILVTFEQEVVPPNHPILQSGGQRANRQSYQYPNGAEIVLAGMDKPAKVMSSQYDVIYPNELIEFSEADLETLTSRNRNFATPFQQVIADTNPAGARHWVKLRGDAGKCRWIESRHEDNPKYWDAKNNRPTAKGAVYFAKLDTLTGARKLRLRYGRWVNSEGVVYPEFDPALHLVDRFEIPPDWPRFRAVDFGFTNPFVCQWWAIDPDDRMVLYREIYRVQRTVRAHAAEIKALEAWYLADGATDNPDREEIETTVADHDAEDRATLAEEEIPTEAADKARTPGFEAVQERLRPAGDGKPRLMIFRDALVERDETLDEAKKPCCTAEEFDCYTRKPSRDGRPEDEDAVKLFDHGMDALRYGVRYADSRSGHYIQVY